MNASTRPENSLPDSWDPSVLLVYPLDTIPGALTELGRRFGDRVAVEADGSTITYAQIARRANDLGVAILDRAPDPAQPIALLLGHGIDPVVLALGALSTGRICVPFDGREPTERLALMLRSSHPQLVVTGRDHAELARTTASDVPVLLLEDVVSADRRCPQHRYEPEDCALVMFTSGSTGAPKGVRLPYAPLVLHTFEWGGLEGLTADDRVAQLSSLSYVMGLLRVLGVLVRGATLCAYDLQERGVRDLPAWMRAQRITMVTGVPSIFRTLRDLVPPDEPIDSVRRVNLFGETVIDTDVRDARALFGADVVVANQFGATEVGGISMYEVLPGTEPAAGPLPAGTTWVGASIVLVDDDDQPVAAGEAGRIVVVNDTMALGYWDAPALTAECFFTTPDGHRGFRTSDRARWRPDGLLEHLGRLDSSVKVRGTMVATNEVEAALTMLAEVTEAAVVAVPDRDGGNHLVAYVAMRSGERPGAWQVRRDVARLVPAAMVPASVVVLDALPHGVRGKIDRAALPPPPAGAAYREPTGKERELAELFGEVLGLDHVGLDDDFFELGGDSLGAIELVASVGDRFGVDVPASMLLDAPTPARLAARVGARRSRHASVLVPLRAAGELIPFVCVTGAGAPALSLRAFSDAIQDHPGAVRPFYAIQARGLEERARPDRSVGAMAGRNARAIRAELGDGPYILAGYSLGGQVAFETALRLVAARAHVPLLVILDTLPTWQRSRPSARSRKPVMRVRRTTAAAVRHARLMTAGIVPRRGLAQYGLFLDLHTACAMEYQPAGRFPGPAVVVRLTGPESIAPRAPRDLGWSDWITGPITVVEMAGAHLDMLRAPCVHEVGARIREALEPLG